MSHLAAALEEKFTATQVEAQRLRAIEDPEESRSSPLRGAVGSAPPSKPRPTRAQSPPIGRSAARAHHPRAGRGADRSQLHGH